MLPNEKTRWLTVVGVVREAQLRGPAIAEVFGGTFYLPYAATAPRDVGLVIRTKGEPSAVVYDVRATLAGIERDAPLFNVRTLAERMQLSLVLHTSTMKLVTIFAGVALLLSALGLYGMLAYLVTQRTREIGVRMAIGSTPREIVGLVLREGITLAVTGIAVGAAGFLATRRVLASQLFGVDASDPRMMIVMTIALVTVAILACVYPARRAARVDVVQILSAR
jgi:putative ABC transport system permease protein